MQAAATARWSKRNVCTTCGPVLMSRGGRFPQVELLVAGGRSIIVYSIMFPGLVVQRSEIPSATSPYST